MDMKECKQREKEQKLKTKLIAEVVKYIAKGKKYEMTQEYAVKILLKFFPEADAIFQSTTRCYFGTMHNLYNFKIDLEDHIHEYFSQLKGGLEYEK